MSTSDDNPFSESTEESLISASLNASMLENYLMGVYSMVYAGTMYLYLSKKRANQRVVVVGISALYLLCFADFVVQWYLLNRWTVINGATRDSIFFATLSEDGPVWLSVLNTFLFYSIFIVADGLLIWRCYHVWGRSLRVISALLLIYLAEISLWITAVTLTGVTITSPNLTDAQVNLSSNIVSALDFISLGTTILATFLIGFRIHTTSRRLATKSPTSPFMHIVVMIIESAAVYSIVLLVFAIITILPSFKLVSNTLFAADYVEAVVSIVGGLAPTVLVARIALTNTIDSVTPEITHVSGLHFGSAPGGAHSIAASEREVSPIMSSGNVPREDEKKAEGLAGENVVEVKDLKTA